MDGVGFGFQERADLELLGLVVRFQLEFADDRNEGERIAQCNLTGCSACVEANDAAVGAGVGVAPAVGNAVV